MNCLPLTVLLKNNCRGLPAASNDTVVSAKCVGVLKAGDLRSSCVRWMRRGAESGRHGLPAATINAAAVEVCRRQPMTQLCPLDELFTPKKRQNRSLEGGIITRY